MRSFLCCFFVCLFSASYGQISNLIFKHLDRSSGLPVDEVNCIAQDSSGFIWLGTAEGLFKYDGFTYKSFYDLPGKKKASLNNHISKIYVDSKGLIWVAVPYSGIAVLKSNGEILDVLNSSVNYNFTGDRPSSICEDQNKKIWCSAEGGLFQLTIKNDKIAIERKTDLKKLGHSTNISGNFVFDRKDRMWLCTYKGLVIYDPATEQLFNSHHNPEQISLLNDTTASANIFRDEETGKIWYNNWQPHLLVYDEKTRLTTSIYKGNMSESKDYSWMISRFFRDSHKRLWAGSGRGLLLVDKNTKNIERSFVTEAANNFSIGSNSILDICEDAEGTFWIATNKGISLGQPYNEQFTNISTNSLTQYPFGDKQVNAIIPVDTATFLIGTYAGDGIYETDQFFNVKKHFFFHSIDYDWVWTFYKDEKNKQVYIATQKGMLLYNCNTHSLKKLTAPPFDQFSPVTAFLPGKDGTIWMPRYRDEIMSYHPSSGAFKRFDLASLGIQPQVIRMGADADDNLWIIGLIDGLFRFDKKKEIIVEKISRQKDNVQSIVQTEIILFKDLGIYYLLGYDQKGLSLYNKQTRSFEHFTVANGLAGNRVSDAWPDNKGNIWLATSNGISRLNLTTKEIVRYNYDNGILQNDILCLTPLTGGRLAAGTNKGIVIFDPGKVEARVGLPPPVITGISIYGRQLYADSFLTNGKAINIPYAENYFSVDYITLQYTHRQQIEYAYQLEGFDKTWIAAGSRRFASYANLPGGNYKLRLRARLPGGEWKESKIPLLITVQTPFYLQWWFIPLCAFVVLLIAFALFRYRVQQLLRMERLRASISSDLHDEVGATLSSISIFSEMAKQSVPAASKAEQYLQRIGDRSRDSIEKMSDIIWSINPQNDSLQQMLIRMKTFINETVEAKDIAVEWEESETISKLKLGMMQRKNFYLLFKEAIINAVKYSDAKTIYVQLSAHNKLIALKVRDDGNGFCMEERKQGNGIKNMKQRAALLNGTFFIESAKGKGTSVHLQFRYA